MATPAPMTPLKPRVKSLRDALGEELEEPEAPGATVTEITLDPEVDSETDAEPEDATTDDPELTGRETEEPEAADDPLEVCCATLADLLPEAEPEAETIHTMDVRLC